MKKILTTILMLIVAVMMTVPLNVQAASTPQMYWVKYRYNLQNYLIGYRAKIYSGCVRTSQMPDGLTSDCLSMSKVSDIMAQLDNDKYWNLTRPIDRRNYLMSTTHQVYVMKKVVMYFEQNLNPNTVLYSANQSAGQNWGVSDLVVSTVSKASGVLLGVNPQDEVLLVYVTDKTPVSGSTIYKYTLKPKSQILQSDLVWIYKNPRMVAFAATNNIPSKTAWTDPELKALQPIVDLGNKTYNYMVSRKVSPTYAKMVMDANRNSAIALGILGAEAKGGMSLIEGAPAMKALTGQIGTQATILEGVKIKNFYQFSGIPSNSGKIATLWTDFTANMNRVSQYIKSIGATNVFPDIDIILKDTIENRTFICTDGELQAIYRTLNNGAEPPRMFAFYSQKNGNIYLSDKIYEGSVKYKEAYVHEVVHRLEDIGWSRGSDLFKFYHPAFQEARTSFLAVKIAENGGEKVIAGAHLDGRTGYPARRFMKLVAERLQKKVPSMSIRQIEADMARAQFSQGDLYYESLFGSNFSQTLDTRFQEYGSLLTEFRRVSGLARTDPSYIPARSQALSKVVAKTNEINQFINSK